MPPQLLKLVCASLWYPSCVKCNPSGPYKDGDLANDRPTYVQKKVVLSTNFEICVLKYLTNCQSSSKHGSLLPLFHTGRLLFLSTNEYFYIYFSNNLKVTVLNIYYTISGHSSIDVLILECLYLPCLPKIVNMPGGSVGCPLKSL